MGKTIVNNWYTYYQNTIEYYESQLAALAAIDLIVDRHESGIWDGQNAYLSVNCQQGVAVDKELFARCYSTNSLIPDRDGCKFRIDVYVKNKEDWIFKYGSELLQQSLRAGYDCNEGYLAERLPRDYPGFTMYDWSKYKKVDTPNEKCLYACSGYKNAYCSTDKDDYYITIDNYLGKYQLVKLIDPHLEITRVEDLAIAGDMTVNSNALSAGSIEVSDDKQEWIVEYGSDLLQQTFLAGYDCNNRYLQERIAHEYPGFEIAARKYVKVDSPDEHCFYACLGYENAYCSSDRQCYYVTIDNYLGKYQLIKRIDALVKVVDNNSNNKVEISVLFSSKIEKILASSDSVPLGIICLIFVAILEFATIFYVFYITF